jgi:hypothetical protein
MKIIFFFLDHVWNEELAGILHQCAKHMDELVFRPTLHSKREQEKKYKLHFLSFNHVFFR